MKVLITPKGFTNYGLDQVERTKSKGLDTHYDATGRAYTHREFKVLTKDADVIIVSADKMDREMMEGCPNLKTVCKFGVGTDNINLDYAKEHGVYIGHYVGSDSRSTTEYVLSMMFMEVRNLYTNVKDMKHHNWNKPTDREICGKRLGIIDSGMIGKYLAEYAYGCGIEVYTYDAFAITEETAGQYHAQISTLEDILADHDYISSHISLLKSTWSMISTEEFKEAEEDAYLLNVARGGIVNEEALYEALKKKGVRSTCFDVYSNEPPREDDKLFTLGNLLLTPHTAVRSMESEQRTCAISTDIILEQLIRGQVDI